MRSMLFPSECASLPHTAHKCQFTSWSLGYISGEINWLNSKSSLKKRVKWFIYFFFCKVTNPPCLVWISRVSGVIRVQVTTIRTWENFSYIKQCFNTIYPEYQQHQTCDPAAFRMHSWLKGNLLSSLRRMGLLGRHFFLLWIGVWLRSGCAICIKPFLRMCGDWGDSYLQRQTENINIGCPYLAAASFMNTEKTILIRKFIFLHHYLQQVDWLHSRFPFHCGCCHEAYTCTVIGPGYFFLHELQKPFFHSNK